MNNKWQSNKLLTNNRSGQENVCPNLVVTTQDKLLGVDDPMLADHSMLEACEFVPSGFLPTIIVTAVHEMIKAIKRGGQQKPARTLRMAAVAHLHLLAAARKDECVVAIDVGTGATKASIVSSAGRVLASGSSPHSAPLQSPLNSSQAGCSRKGGQLSIEQDPEIWWSATRQAVQSCMSLSGVDTSYVRALAVTGQMQDVICLPNADAAVRTPAILYSDSRAFAEVNEIAELVGGPSQLSKMTGSLQGASSVLAKLRWLDKYKPGVFQSCKRLLFGGHDYVTWKLCDEFVTDTTTLSTTGLANKSFQYAYDLINQVSLDHWIDKLPPLVPADVPCGKVTAKASQELGFPAFQGLSVLHSCGDAGACTLGAGAANPGALYAYLGTSGWVAGTFEWCKDNKMISAPGVFTLGHPNPRHVFKTGSIMTAGGNMAWASNNLAYPGERLSFHEINELAAASPLACGGLLYLPFLNGERCPMDDPSYRAAFIGISSTTKPADLLRAIMEGVAFAMRSAKEALVQGRQQGPLRLVGGGARSLVWPDIMAGVFNQTVDVLEDAQDVGVKGAALLAGKYLGWHTDMYPGGDWLRVKRSYEPVSSNVEAYNELYAVYQEACKGLHGVFGRLSR